jgi:hypothetical protein
MKEDNIASELLLRGYSLWSSVECDVKGDRVVIYARLRANPSLGVERALAESERVFKSVLEHRVEGHNWVAAVQWSERLCKTFTLQTRGEQVRAPAPE